MFDTAWPAARPLSPPKIDTVEMEFVASNNDTAISAVLMPTFNAFMPLLEKKRQIIQSVRRETMKYGDTERHMVSGILNTRILTSRGFKSHLLSFDYGSWMCTTHQYYPLQAPSLLF